MVTAEQDCSCKENFRHAIKIFLKKALHKEKHRDHQYMYLVPGGDYNVQKALVTKPINHLHCWEEMLHVAELLPVGNIITPSAKLQVNWFYMTFYKTNQVEYIFSGWKLHRRPFRLFPSISSLSTILE